MQTLYKKVFDMVTLCDMKTQKKFQFKLKYNFLCYVISFLDDSPHKKFKYAHYQNLIYKAALGVSASKLKKKHGLHKSIAIYTFLENEELERCSIISNIVSLLILNGNNYEYIKRVVLL
jgi:hypothetical protein